MTKTALSTFDNKWFNKGRSVPIVALWYICNRIFLNSYWLPFSGIKVLVLRLFGARIGQHVLIKPHINIKYPWRLKIGNHVWIGENVWIDNLTLVEISDNVCISQGAMLLCGNHNYKRSGFDLIVGKIILEDGVWIGANAVVCPGVVCKSHALLTASSIATRNLEAYSVYQGNPAKKIKDRIIK